MQRSPQIQFWNRTCDPTNKRCKVCRIDFGTQIYLTSQARFAWRSTSRGKIRWAWDKQHKVCAKCFWPCWGEWLKCTLFFYFLNLIRENENASQNCVARTLDMLPRQLLLCMGVRPASFQKPSAGWTIAQHSPGEGSRSLPSPLAGLHRSVTHV